MKPYLTPEEREKKLDRLAEKAHTEALVLGESVEGRPIRACKLPCKQKPEGAVLLCGNIHGVELIASHTALGFMEALVEGRFAALTERADVFFLPCINPDGYAKTWEAEGVGELGDLRANKNGVDLNRNFPKPEPQTSFKWIEFSGSDDPKSSFYRGTGPFSEPETKAVEELLAREKLAGSISLHSFMGTVIPPRVTEKADFETYKRLARAFASGQAKIRYRRVASRTFDVFTGEMEDHQHHVYGTWAVTVEIFPVLASYRQHLSAPSLFWRFNPREPERWYANDFGGIAAYFLEVLNQRRTS